MAGVTDRGQLLLAGAFVLAVALIGLTLLLTAGGFTTTLASQDSAVERGTDAVAVRDAVRSDLARYLQRANGNYTSLSDRRSAFRAVVPELNTGVRDQYGARGRLVEIRQPSPSQIETGIRIAQPTTDTFGDLDDDSDGVVTLAADRRARNASFVFDTVPSTSNPFVIRLVTPSGSENWRVSVGQSGPGWDVTVENSAGSFDQTCTRLGTSDDMTVDLSAATVDGTYCEALEAVDLATDSYDTVLTGELSVNGRFWMTVDGLGGGRVSKYSASSNTELEDVVYGARVPFSYHSASVAYETELYVAPGEIR